MHRRICCPHKSGPSERFCRNVPVEGTVGGQQIHSDAFARRTASVLGTEVKMSILRAHLVEGVRVMTES